MSRPRGTRAPAFCVLFTFFQATCPPSCQKITFFRFLYISTIYIKKDLLLFFRSHPQKHPYIAPPVKISETDKKGPYSCIYMDSIGIWPYAYNTPLVNPLLEALYWLLRDNATYCINGIDTKRSSFLGFFQFTPYTIIMFTPYTNGTYVGGVYTASTVHCISSVDIYSKLMQGVSIQPVLYIVSVVLLYQQCCCIQC